MPFLEDRLSKARALWRAASALLRSAAMALAFLIPEHTALAQQGTGVTLEMAPEGRSYSIKAPGLELVNARWIATLEIDGALRHLLSSGGKVLESSVLKNQSTPYGPADVALSKIRFEEEGIDLLLRLEKIDGLPVVLVNAGIHVFGSKGCTLLRLHASAGDLVLEEGPGAWVVSGAVVENSRPGRVVARVLQNGEKLAIFEECSLYKSNDKGVLIGPVGVPEAFTNANFEALDQGRMSVAISSAMSGVRVEPGKTRWGQQMGCFFESPQAAWDRWSDWVVKTHGARVARGGVTGWASGAHELNSGAKVLEILNMVGASPAELRPQVILIDGGYWKSTSNLMETNSRFHEGLAFYAAKILETKAAPGLFFFFDTKQCSRGEVQQNFDEAKRMGFTFFKILFLAPSVSGATLEQRTQFQEIRRTVQKIRNDVGAEVSLLSVMDGHKRAQLGAVDSSRVAENVRRGTIRDRIMSCLWNMPLAGRWFAVDNDAFYLATELEGVSPVVGGWPLARTWMSMVGLSCGNAFTTDDLSSPTFKPYWRNFEAMTPPARERTRVLDVGTALEWPRLAGKVVRDWGEWAVALLWNPEEKERVVDLDLEAAGLNPAKRHAVWSFWDNRYLGVVDGTYKTPFLAPSASQHLVFTPLSEDSSKPVVIGSNLHIYCGAAEFKNVVALPGAMRIEFTDAGARSGSVFVYCKSQPILEGATGLEVEELHSAGENVWEIKIKNRVPAGIQRIDLGIPVPLTRQSWFWLLCGLLALSGGFGVLKYRDSKRSAMALISEQTRQQERARIARDLHDELGATLARISMLGEAPADSADDTAPLLRRMVGFSREALQRLDEIVWAMNPARDTLEHLVDFLCKFAEEYVHDAGLSIRFETSDAFPQMAVASKPRHAIYMVVREAIRNAVRHGRPSLVQLGISTGDSGLLIEIHDDGGGFDPARTSSGNGLKNMRSRIAEIGARLDLSSSHGHGTTVTLHIPFTSL